MNIEQIIITHHRDHPGNDYGYEEKTLNGRNTNAFLSLFLSPSRLLASRCPAECFDRHYNDGKLCTRETHFVVGQWSWHALQ